jgi:hypothetical protein
MVWWNDIQAWFNSATGSKIFLDAVLPFLAIVLAGVIAALIGRGFALRVVEQKDREHTGAAVIALIMVGRRAAIWSSLGADEKQHIDSLMSEADIKVRLLPVNGSNLAADWAAHELGAMKKNSASFSFQAEQSLIEYRDRLLDWQAKPRRARKLFASDLDQWRYDDDSQSGLVAQQQAWATDHVEPPKTSAVPTGPTSVTPGLATAAPPTAAPMSAPAPTEVALSPAVPATRAVSRPVETADEVKA